MASRKAASSAPTTPRRVASSEPNTPRKSSDAGGAQPATAETPLAELREGMMARISIKLEKAVASMAHQASTYAHINAANKAIALEKEIYNHSLKASRANLKVTHRQIYLAMFTSVENILLLQEGAFPDDVVSLMFLDGRRTAGSIIELSKAPPEAVNERTKMQRIFIRTLMRADPAYATDQALTLETSRLIEISCYNAAVRISKESEEPPRRAWDSSAFVDIYSTRTGTIIGMLDPDSTSSNEYGTNLARLMLEGTLLPLSLGNMSEKDLCPQATAAERAEIAKRSNQKVEMKESILFRCPHCGERRSTYNEVQKRSLDEAPDYNCLCLNENCRRRFAGRY
jgi:hypothetical protein